MMILLLKTCLLKYFCLILILILIKNFKILLRILADDFNYFEYFKAFLIMMILYSFCNHLNIKYFILFIILHSYI